MVLTLETEEIRDSYEKVRNTDDVKWVAYGYVEDFKIGVVQEGTDHEQLLEMCKDDARLYFFTSFNVGDEMSVRKKFVFASWVGEHVPPKKKAAVSTDKSEVKKIIQNFALEVHASSKDDLKESIIMASLKKAGGANYGTAS